MTKIKPIKGLDGKPGRNGLNGRDGRDGHNGLSAYELAVKNGFKGSEKEFLNMGAWGGNGKNGKDGRNGIDGKNGRDGKNGINGRDGIDGKDGLNGLDGRNGKDGKDGKDGLDGAKGADGLSAYDLAVAHGFIGTEEQYACSFLTISFSKIYKEYYDMITDRSEDVKVGRIVGLITDGVIKPYVRCNLGAGADKWCILDLEVK